MFGRRKRNIFAPPRQRRDVSNWIVAAATLVIGITVAVPSVAGGVCGERGAPCPPVQATSLASASAISVATAQEAQSAGKVSVKRRVDPGREKILGMAVLGLIAGQGGGGTAALGFR